MKGHTAAVEGVAFSPNGQLLATGSQDNTVRLWDVATGRPHGRPLIRHSEAVSRVAFSSDSNLLASTSADTSIQLWDVATGQPFGPTLRGHEGSAWGVAFSPDDQLLATAGGDGEARLWNYRFTQWVSAGCVQANRNLSLEEWNQLLGNTPYERTCPELPAGQGAPTDAPVAQYLR